MSRHSFSFLLKRIFLILLIVFSFNNTCSAEWVMDGSVPPWITGETCDLVMNMRALAGKLTAYYPHVSPYPDENATTCCYSVSICLRGSPYGDDPELGLDFSRKYDRDMTVVDDQLVAKAKEIGDWHEYGTYEPQPGDLVVNSTKKWKYAHVSMITESGGIIYNGSTKKGGIAETDWSPETVYGKENIQGYIETSKYGNGVGILDNVIDWGLDMLATIADGLNKLIEDFALYATEAMNAISSIGVGIILSLIIIDFTTYLFFNGFEWQLSQLISKIMKYTFLLFIFMNWTWIVNNIFLDFAQSTASAMAGGGNVSSNLTQPQFLLRKGVEAISPCLNFISTAKGLTNPKNWPILLFLVLITFIVLGFLMFSAFYVAYVYIEFYLMAAFNALFMIFPTLRFTKFIAEGGISGLITNTIRLFTTAWLVYLIADLSENANYALVFPADIGALSDGTLYRYIFLCIHIVTLVIVIVKVPDKIARMYGGSINLPN